MKLRIIALAVPMLFALACAKEEQNPPPASGTSTTTTSNAAASGAGGAGGGPAAVADTAAATPPGPSAAAASAAAPSTTTPPAGAGEIAVGQPPPDFTATDQNGKPVHLAALKGKPIVVYFYPKDETPGCTKEACAFRDAWNDLSKKGVVLLGVSADTEA